MAGIVRKTGIEVVGDVPWGTHLCQFYKTKEDLIDILVPYFKAGLENNEFCMWVTSEPLSSEEARNALTAEVNNLDEYIAKGQIEILDYSQWYTKSGRFNAEEVLQAWVEKEKKALASGFDGLRLTGNTFWLEQKDWQDFADYEAEINRVIGKYRMLAICTYSLGRCTPSEIIDVVSNHEFALIRREHNWEIIESAKHTETLEALRESEEKFRNLAEQSPNMIFINKGRRIVYANERCEKVMGYDREELCSADFDFLTLIAEEHRESIKANFSTHMRGQEVPPFEYTIVTRDGTRVEAILTTKLIQYEGERAILGTVTDITQRKEAERGLQKSETKLRTLIENAPIGIYVNDLEGRFIYGNENAERIIGRSKDEFIDRNFLDLDILGPEDVEKAKILQGLHREGKRTGPDEFVLNRRDGAQRTVEVTTVVIDFEGTKAVLGMVQDVTEHRQAEHGLMAEKEFTESALNAQMDTFFVFEAATGKALRWNRAFSRISGYSDDQIRSMKAPDSCYSQEDMKKGKAATEKILNGKAASVELSLITRDGRSIPTEYTASLIRDNEGNPKYIIALGRDITERKRAAEAMRESEEKYRAIFEQAADSIVLIDAENGDLVEFNNQTHENLGYTREEFEHLRIPDFEVIESTEEVAAHFEKITREGADTFETKHRTKNGRIRDILVSSRAIRIGCRDFIYSIWRDITERMKAQEQMQSLAKFPSEDPNPVLRISKDCTIVYANEPSEPVLETWQCRVGERLPEACRYRVEDALASGKVLTFEFECTNGRVFFVTLAPSADGSYANAYGVDITEPKAAERELHIRNQINNIFLTCPNEQMYAKVLELVLEALESKYGTFGYFDASARFVVPAMTREIYWGKCNVPEKDIIFERGQFSGIWARAVQERKTLYSNAGPFNAPAGHIPIENTMVTPIVYKDEIISAIHIANKPGGYDEKDKALLEMMADYVAPVLYARLDRDRRESQRKKAEAALRESENKHRTLLKNIPQKIFYKDLNSAYVLCNESFAEDLKVKPKEVKGKTDYDFFPKDLAEKYRADDKRILESGNAEEIEEEYLTDGKNIVVHTFKAPLKNEQGDTIGLFGIFWDITEQRKAQEALKRSEERYALAQQAANVGSWDWNIPSGKLTWSEQIEPMFGFGRGEFARTYEAFLECVHPDDRQYVVDSINACVEARQDYAIEHRIVWPDGSIRWLSEKGDVIHDEAGNAIRMLGVVQDITERKTAEEQLLLGSSILEIINQKEKGQDIIRRILQLVKDFTGFDAVGIRLREGDDYPYFEVNGFSEDFVSQENYLCARDESGQTLSDSQGRPVLDCMCGNVILGHADPAAPFFTQAGSFWTNSTTNLLASTSEKERLTHTRNHCNRAGYESVALIPLRSGAQIVGLLQLNDHRKGRFAVEMVRFFEGIGDSVGIALARMNAEEEIESVARFPSENPYPVLRINKDGTMLYANSAGSALLKDWGCKIGDHAPKHWQQYISRILGSGRPEELETPCGDRIFSLTITPVVDAGYVNVYGTDVTERKRAEEDLRQYRQHLEELVAARTAELQETNERLRLEIDQRKQLEKQLLEISEREKRLIGQELHDSIGQQFTGIAFMTKVLEKRLTDKLPEEAAGATEIAKLVNEAMSQTRILAKGLHPVDLDAESLMSALQELAATTERLFGVNCSFGCDKPVPIHDTAVAVNLYRIAQEAVTNAIKHGKAENIQIGLVSNGGQSVLTVKNDGLDFGSAPKKSGGMGLNIMHHRAEIIKGSLDICRNSPAGTEVTCIFPNDQK